MRFLMLQIFNTLSRQKEVFKPLKEKDVHMYVCGITPYDTTHLGHAFTYVSFDVLLKYLVYKGYQVTYTQNVTDVNDRDKDILQRAQEQGCSWQQLAEFWTKKFLEDMATLNWTKPTYYLYASQQIPAMIELIQKILTNGYGYEVHGGVYLDVGKYEGYGKLSKLTLEQMRGIAKDFEEDLDNPDKKHPLDITLWKPAVSHQSSHIPSFDSPWGKGRPGWHIECSAMAISTLGEQIDIHGGGIDLIYPHHESEITQSETATGKIPFAKYWMHVNLVQKNHEKMSKSKGNLVMVSDVLTKYSANAIRWYLLSHQYRQAWNFEEPQLGVAEGFVQKLHTALHLVEKATTESDIHLIKQFEDLMDDDLNTPGVLEIIKEKLLKQALLPEEKKSLSLISRTLGFSF